MYAHLVRPMTKVLLSGRGLLTSAARLNKNAPPRQVVLLLRLVNVSPVVPAAEYGPSHTHSQADRRVVVGACTA